MIQAIGVMIGGYILTRYFEMAKGASFAFGLWLLAMLLVTAGCMAAILLTSAPPLR